MTHPLRPSSTPTNDTTETWIVQEALGRVQARNPPDLSVPPTGRWRSWARRHWLGLLTTMNLLLFLGTFLSPALFALGWSDLARPAFAVYQVLCMQRPTHSFFLWGYQMSMEQRMVIIPGAQVLAGLIYALLPGRRTLRPLNAWLFVLGSLPMLVDIFSQTPWAGARAIGSGAA